MTPLASLLLAAALGARAQTPAAALTRIGAAAAVKGLVQARAPEAAAGRVVESGKPLFLNDHVTTDAAGRLQILLLDETVFTVGPNSDMVLDEFVYDPASGAGKVTARITKGVFRFVTGKISRKNPGRMNVKLPVGTIGIRGTIAAGEASESGSTVILLGPGLRNNANENPGSISVGNAGGEVIITQPGFGTTIAPGQPPATVTAMSQQARQIMGALGESPAGQAQGGSGGGSLSGGPPPSQQAGQNTAHGGELATRSLEVGELTKTLNTDTNNAAQEAAKAAGIADGISTWDQVRGVQAGTARFSGTGAYACSPDCLPGNISVALDVDFGARRYGSYSSDVYLYNGTLDGKSTTIYETCFANLGGNAAISLNTATSYNSSNPQFDGTTLTFMNRGGVAAKDIEVGLNYSDSSSGISASGSAIAERSK